jgi:hypothetical protein
MKRKTRTCLPSLVVSLVLLVPVVYAVEAATATRVLPWKKGDIFSFQSEKGPSAKGAQVTDSRGAVLARSLPARQTVQVTDVGTCQGKKCVFLQIEREVPPPPETPFKNEKFTERIVAGIDQETGDILSMKTILSGAGSVSTSTQRSLSRAITVGDFYGPWMMDVDDKYKRSAKKGTATSSLETVGRKSYQGRDCFLVRKTLAVQAGPTVRLTYWVDVKSRFAVRIEEEGGRTLTLSKG